MNEAQGEKILVVGLGESGAAVCEHFLKRGTRVTATDLRAESEITCAPALRERGAALECGGHREETFTSADWIVLSPGVPPTIPALEAARRKGIPITGELELGAREAASSASLRETSGARSCAPSRSSRTPRCSSWRYPASSSRRSSNSTPAPPSS